MQRVRLFLTVCVVGLAALTGCGGGGGTSEPTNKGDEPASAVKQIDAAKLPELGDYLSGLDGGKLEVAPPAGWVPKSRSAEYVCAFTKEKGVQLPAIVVKVADPPVDDFDDVTTDNVAEFTTALRKHFKSEKGGRKLIEQPVPLVLGQNAFARYVKEASINNLPAEVQVLGTVRGGRFYTVELRLRPKEILKFRDDGYAVGAGLKFGGSSAPAVPSTPPIDAPPPADTPPAEPAKTDAP